MNTEGEYWVFAVECLQDGVEGKSCELDPATCMECKHCELTYVPDMIVMTPDFNLEGGD